VAEIDAKFVSHYEVQIMQKITPVKLATSREKSKAGVACK